MVKLPCVFNKVVQTSLQDHSEVHVRSAVDECEKNTSTSLLVCVLCDTVDMQCRRHEQCSASSCLNSSTHSPTNNKRVPFLTRSASKSSDHLQSAVDVNIVEEQMITQAL
jgi:hypothetical protein